MNSEIIKAFRSVEIQTEEVCLHFVRLNGMILEFVKVQTEEICIEAVKQNGFALCHVKEQTLEICIGAIKQNGYALMFVEGQTSDIISEANLQLESDHQSGIFKPSIQYNNYTIKYR